MEGYIQSSSVNFYQDQTSDTELKLEGGNIVLFSGVAPVPRGNRIQAEGMTRSYLKILQEIHPNIPIEKLKKRAANPTEEAFHANSVQDMTSNINYDTW